MGFDLTPRSATWWNGYYAEVVEARVPKRVLGDPHYLRSLVLQREGLILSLFSIVRICPRSSPRIVFPASHN